MELLTKEQKHIVNECIAKNSGGMSVAMGGGKTLMSLVLAMNFMQNEGGQTIVIVSKSLINSWIFEINKFFPKLKYIVFHSEYIKDINNYVIKEDIQIVITTPELTSKYYKKLSIETLFVSKYIVNEGQFGQHEVVTYNPTNCIPFYIHNDDKISGNYIYKNVWTCMIVDEGHDYFKISTNRSRSISSICTKHRWILSGTLFDSPTPEKILGFYVMCNIKICELSIPRLKELIYSDNYQGINNSLVIKKELDKLNINVDSEIIEISMNDMEQKIYNGFRQILIKLKERVEMYKLSFDTNNTRKFSAYKLAMVTYLRQSLISPIIPLTKIYIDLINLEEENRDLSKMFRDEIFVDTDMINFLNDKNNLISSRIKRVLQESTKHDKIVIFSSYRTTLNLLYNIILQEYGEKAYTFDGSMTSKKRDKVLNEFRQCQTGILLLTYDIGGKGLNLQEADTVFLFDFDWSDGITSQAISRVVRRGQTKDVTIKYFMSNTKVEKFIFTKHKEKLDINKELEVGQITTKIKSFKIDDIIEFIENDENANYYNENLI